MAAGRGLMIRHGLLPQAELGGAAGSASLSASAHCASLSRFRKLEGAKARSSRTASNKRPGPCIRARAEVPDFLPTSWTKPRSKELIGPALDLTAEAVVQLQLSCLKKNDDPYADHGVEVMYRFAAFDPFELCRYFGPRLDLGQFANFDPFQRAHYFGPRLDLGQFERFRRLFHHSTYRVLLCHKEHEVLSSFYLSPGQLRQRVRVVGLRPGEDDVFEFTVIQREGGNWDGYWFTESLVHDGEGLSRGIAY